MIFRFFVEEILFSPPKVAFLRLLYHWVKLSLTIRKHKISLLCLGSRLLLSIPTRKTPM